MPNALHWLLFPAAVLLASCDTSAPDPADPCADPKLAQKIFYGTLEPTHVPLPSSQILAIGSLQRCTGTLIAPTWVITAQHCNIGRSEHFCMGSDPADPDVCIPLVRVVNHPSLDITLLELSEDANTPLPEVRPIAIMTEALSSQWIGCMAEAAGYGQTEQGSLGTRYFTAEPISKVESTYVAIDGQSRHGACFGDSGGPVMVLAGDASVRVAGTLSYGADSCVGEDFFIRTDAMQSWIESHTGPTQPSSSL